MKAKCKCGKWAVWLYAPATLRDREIFFCEDCVPRGCSCNSMMHPEENLPVGHPNADVYRDDEGRELPCVEYDFDEDGWDDLRAD